MVLHLAEELAIPIRERNVLLVAAGYAPVFTQSSLDDPALAAARRAVDLVLEAQRPYPAFAIDRHWIIVASNEALPELYAGVLPELLTPPINGLRLSLHPQGLAPRTVNFREWRAHLLAVTRQRLDLTGDPVLAELLQEVSSYPVAVGKTPLPAADSVRPLSCRSRSSPLPVCCHSSAPPRCSARRSMSLCRNWRWNCSFPRTPQLPRSYIVWPARPAENRAGQSRPRNS